MSIAPSHTTDADMAAQRWWAGAVLVVVFALAMCLAIAGG